MNAPFSRNSNHRSAVHFITVDGDEIDRSSSFISLDVKPKMPNVTLIDDSHLPAGTKQRALSFFDRYRDNDVWIAVCASIGTAQVLVSYAANLRRKINTQLVGEATREPVCHVFVVGPHHRLIHRAEEYGAIVHRVRGSVKDAIDEAQRLFGRSEREGHYPAMIPFGLEHPKFIRILTKVLVEQVEGLHLRNFDGKVFVATGSGVLLKCLLQALPKAHFVAVQVGRYVQPQDRVCVKKAPERFSQPAERPPPYPSIAEYDAKVRRFVEEMGEDGDVVWNVAA